MPNMANMTVKKNDGTTDIVWTGVVPSSGDKNDAVWRSLTIGSAMAHKPSFSLRSYYNGPRTARRLEGKLTYPMLATGTDGKVNVVDRCIIDVGGLVPMGMNDADINEAVSQAMNLFVQTLIKDSFKTGYAPT